jgi:hypothetical protein
LGRICFFDEGEGIQLALLKQKFQAFGWHFLVTVLVAAFSGLLIFSVWYPDQLASYVGGVELYQLVLLVELGIGPLMSLVIFNPAKPRTELVRDYCIVGLIQVSALVYGMYVVAESRPAFIVFVKDRLEVVTAIDLTDEDYDQATGLQFSSAPWLGPQRICVKRPETVEERNDLIFSAVGGKDIQLYPKYYRECHQGEVGEKSYPGERLKLIAQAKAKGEGIQAVFPEGEFTWLPVKHRFGAWVEVYPENDLSKGYFVDVNPFE